MRPPQDTTNIVTPAGDYSSSPLSASDYNDESPKLICGGGPAADPDSACHGGRAPLPRGSGHRGQRVVPDCASDPGPALRPRTPRGLEARGTPLQKKKELAALKKSWTNFSGEDGCGRVEWDWGVAPTSPVYRRRNSGSPATPTPCFPPPQGQDARLEERRKGISPRAHTKPPLET